jgi:hypothetical protein
VLLFIDWNSENWPEKKFRRVPFCPNFSWLGLERRKSSHFVDLASIIESLGGFWRPTGLSGCRGDTLIWHFSGGFGVWDRKSRFSGVFLHFGVAATLCKIWSRAMMWA